MAAAPFSKKVHLGVEDVRDLAALVLDRGLQAERPPGSHDDGSGDDADIILRPPKIDALLASRACRSAIMIGRWLNRGQMKRVLSALARLHQPWNCPHGRPTLRHLVDIRHIVVADAGTMSAISGSLSSDSMESQTDAANDPGLEGRNSESNDMVGASA